MKSIPSRRFGLGTRLDYQILEPRKVLAGFVSQAAPVLEAEAGSESANAVVNLIDDLAWKELSKNVAPSYLNTGDATGQAQGIRTDNTLGFDGVFQKVDIQPFARYQLTFEHRVNTQHPVGLERFRVIWNDRTVGEYQSSDEWVDVTLVLRAHESDFSRLDVREVTSVYSPGGDGIGSELMNIRLVELSDNPDEISPPLFPSRSTLSDPPKIESVSLGGFGASHLEILESGRPIVEGSGQLVPLAWTGVNQIAVAFDQPVVLENSHFEFRAVNSQPTIVGFTYDSDSNTGIWQLFESLESDKYEIVISDRVANEAGERLDGEWVNEVTETSGTGIAGGDFNFRFDIQHGDVNGDGQTDVKDYSFLDNEIDEIAEDLAFDLNFDLAVSNEDLQLLVGSFGARRPVLGPDVHSETENLGDINDNAVDEVAILQTFPSPTISIYDSNSPELINRVFLNSSFKFIDIEPVIDQGVTTGIAALGINLNSGGVRVWLWDMASTNPTSSYSFGRSVLPKDLEILATDAGVRILVMGEIPGGDNTRVWTVDPVTSALSSVFIGSRFVGLDLEVKTEDGIGEAEFAVSGFSPVSGGVQVRTFSATSHLRTGLISFGKVEAVDFEIFNNHVSAERNYAVLRGNRNGKYARVEIKSEVGTRVELKAFKTDGLAKDLLQWPDLNAGGEVKIGVLVEHPDHFENRVFVSTAGSGSSWEGVFGSGYRSNSFSIADVDGETAILIDQLNHNLGVQQVKVRIAEQNVRVVNIPTSINALSTEWFDSNLVHGHTRLYGYHPNNPAFYGTEGYDNAGEYFKDLGANVFTRHARTFDEDPWWPSEVPVDAAGQQIFQQPRDNHGVALGELENPIQRAVNDAWESSLPMLAYYNDASEAGVAEANPDWLCKNHRGETASHATKGEFLDITGPYGDITEQRLLELADMGVSGLYLDFRHLPVNGCWETQLAADFTAQTGLDVPTLGRTPEYQRFIEFTADRLTETITGWKETVQAQYPQVEFLVSVTSVPGLTRLDMATSLASIDNVKSEFSIPLARGQNNSVFENNPELYRPDDDIRMAFGWSLLRDSTENGKSHLWNLWSPNGDQDKAFVASVITYGAIAAVDVAGPLLVSGGTAAGISSRDEVRESFEFGNKISPHLANVTPIGWAAVHFSENSRNAHFQFGDKSMWENVQLPAIGGFQALTEMGMSPAVLNDSQLESSISPEVQVLFVPDPSNLTTSQQLAIADFEARGGTLIGDGNSWDWSTGSGYQAAIGQFKSEILAIGSVSPIVVNDLPDKVHAVANTKIESSDGEPTIVVSVTNDFTFVQKSFVLNPLPADQVNPTPPAVEAGVTIAIDNSFHASLAGRSAAQLFAYDAVSEQTLNITKTAGGFEIVLPEFQQMIVAVVELI